MRPIVAAQRVTIQETRAVLAARFLFTFCCFFTTLARYLLMAEHTSCTSIHPLVRSAFYAGGAHAVLLIHGYMGTPREMQFLGRALHRDGFTVSIPRLPGHGTNREDFLETGWRDWLRRVCDEYRDLSAAYPSVSVGGLSMGGVLTALVAARFCPQKAFFCAPGFAVSDWRIKLSPLVRWFVREFAADAAPFYPEQDFNDATKDYRSAHYIAQVAQFYALQRRAIRSLACIRITLLTILSRQDPLVPCAAVQKLLDARVRSAHQYVVLEHSGHVITDDVEREQVASCVSAFLRT